MTEPLEATPIGREGESATVDHAAAPILAALRALSPRARLLVIERAIHEIANEPSAPQHPASIVGLFADEPELLETIADAAMNARERDPLRTGR